MGTTHHPDGDGGGSDPTRPPARHQRAWHLRRQLGPHLLPIDLMDRYFPLGHGQADHTLLRAAPGTGPAALGAAVQRVLVRYPEVTVTDPATYRQQRAGDLGDLGGILGLLTVLVLLAAAVATLGIANTLALVVAERTREFGLLRAVA